jgi:hypothetical protein
MSREQREALDALGAFVDRWLTARANRSERQAEVLSTGRAT